MKIEIDKLGMTKEEFIIVFSDLEKIIIESENKIQVEKAIIINLEETKLSDNDMELKIKEFFNYVCVAIKVKNDFILGITKEDEELINESVSNFRNSFSGKTNEEEHENNEEEKIKSIDNVEKVLEERELGSKIEIIIKNEKLVTKIKEHCENINQYTYILKNNINFMTFYYIKLKGKTFNYDNYEKIYKWYKDLSETKIIVKEYNINYSIVSKESFLEQKQEFEKIEKALDNLFKFFSRDKYSYDEFNKKSKNFKFELFNLIKKNNILEFLERGK